jgi:putative CRISPR-associated protein (TIGR02619 family)
MRHAGQDDGGKSLVVATCGTSLLTNKTELRDLLTQTANYRPHEFAPATLEPLEKHLQERIATLGSSPLSKLRQMSAEINGLLAFYGGDWPPGGRAHHILIHSDTLQGQRVAEALKDWLLANGTSCEARTWSGLSTRSVEEFQNAMAEVMRWASEELPAFREQGYSIAFHLTGGFKSVNGFLQTLGMLHADEVCYLFESSSELIRIPRLPLSLEVEKVVTQHSSVLRELSVRGELPEEQCRCLPETLLMVLDGKAALSAWGELVWGRAKAALYQRELLPPLSPRIALSERFRKDAAELPPDRLYQVNLRLDDLAAYLDSDQRRSPRSVRLKALSGKPVEGSTHELYAWSDADARRIFAHCEGDVLWLDSLGKHL